MNDIVVLGGTSGIGLAVATRAAAEGFQVTVVSRRRSSVDKAVAALPGATGAVVDLGAPDELAGFFAARGEFDHLVYTAGEPLSLMPVDTLDLDAARRFFDVRYFGALAAVKAARVRESITLTSGTAAARGGHGWGIGASICGAIEALTRSLAVELAPLRVNAVAPGVVRSPLWQRMSEADRERMYADTGAAIPAGRVGEVEDVAQAFLYCITQRWTTGTVVTVDGGTVLA
jgi:NAD(P)-dependent dehydrogenase (short-subunit alcohol dehydrogenase family)